jgi:hypothetical protein
MFEPNDGDTSELDWRQIGRPMVARWSRRFAHPIAPPDGERMIELRDVAQYMLGIGDRHKRRAWQQVAALLLEAAERDASLDAVRRQTSSRS